MLLPVAASSGTTSGVAPAKASAAGEQPVQTSPRNPTVASAASDTGAQKLNLALLGGLGRRGDNFGQVAEVVGQFLGVARGGHEPLDAYLARLVTAIDALPDADRHKLQAFVAQTFSKLQLASLIAAFADPKGEEAMTVAIALELACEVSGDRKAQTVIASYHQAREPSSPTPTQTPVAHGSPAEPGRASPQTADRAVLAPAATKPAAGQPARPYGPEAPLSGEKGATMFASSEGQPAANHTGLPLTRSGTASASAVSGAAVPDAAPPGAEEGDADGRRTDARPASGFEASKGSNDRLAPSVSREATGGHAGDLEKVGERGRSARDTDHPPATPDKMTETRAERAAQAGIAQWASLPAALASLRTAVVSNGQDLISSLFTLAQTAGTQASTAATANAQPFGQADNGGHSSAQPRQVQTAEAAAAAAARPELREGDGRENTVAPPTLGALQDTVILPTHMRDAVPFAILQYLVHDDEEARLAPPEETETGDDEGGEADEDAEESGESAGDEQNEQAPVEASADAAVDLEDDLETAADQPAERFPKPRAQRLKEAQEGGLTYRELSSTDPMHQMYVRMSGGI